MGSASWVALLAEGVDRNTWDMLGNGSYMVALLAEGVDRNIIESRIRVREVSVALLAEGVDRNKTLLHPKKED